MLKKYTKCACNEKSTFGEKMNTSINKNQIIELFNSMSNSNLSLDEKLFEIYKTNRLYKSKEYKTIDKKLRQIKLKYTKVREFIEDGKIGKFTPNEQEAILEVRKLEGDIEMLEKKEAFRLGMLEGNIV